MKTSEFIRTSVKSHMAISLKDFNTSAKSRWLCQVFEWDDVAWKVTYPELAELVKVNCRWNSCLFHEGGTDTEDHYILRWMFAEFMALYFEDLGD